MTGALPAEARAPGRRGRIALLYDCTYPHVPGGGQKRLFEIFRRLVAKGWSVDWYGLKAWEGEDDPVIEGITYIPVGPARALYGADGKRSILQTLHYGKAIAGFPRIGGYDRIHIGQWPYFHFFPVRLFALFGGARVSTDWWEVWGSHWREYYGAKGWLGMGLEWLCSHLAGRLVAISETGARQLGGLGNAARRITVIHNGIDHGAISTAVPAAERSDLVYLGRLQPHKNVNLLIEALALLAARGQHLRLAIIGDGPERAALEQLGRERGVAGQIRWLGAIESDAEVHGHLAASRVFVHPSTKEGGGSITSLEANAAGLPVVAFCVEGGISPELIMEGQNGTWVQQVDADGLAAGIVRVMEFTRNSDCKLACIDFASKFDWEKIADEYHSFFMRASENDGLIK